MNLQQQNTAGAAAWLIHSHRRWLGPGTSSEKNTYNTLHLLWILISSLKKALPNNLTTSLNKPQHWNLLTLRRRNSIEYILVFAVSHPAIECSQKRILAYSGRRLKKKKLAYSCFQSNNLKVNFLWISKHEIKQDLTMATTSIPSTTPKMQ